MYLLNERSSEILSTVQLHSTLLHILQRLLLLEMGKFLSSCDIKLHWKLVNKTFKQIVQEFTYALMIRLLFLIKK